MTRRLRWLCVTPAFLVVVALSCDVAVAADKTRVDQATKQVEQGAKFSGENIKEFFQKAFGSSRR